MPLEQLPQILQALGIEDFNKLILLRASSLLNVHYPPFAPDQPVLIFDMDSAEVAKKIKDLLNSIYAQDQPCKQVSQNGQGQWTCKEITINAVGNISNGQVLYLPAALPNSSLEAFAELVAHLRAPEGCPWDREQTHQSLRPNLLAETYEVLQALDEQDTAALKEELGDLLLQIVLHAQIASQAHEFNLSQVIAAIHKKIVNRHPHVFADVKVEGSEGVIRNWEILKSAEREENGEGTDQSILAHVPVAMPALALAQEYQKRAARVGFDWAEIQPVLAKVYEELKELEQAETPAHLEAELGDLLFAVVNLARWHKVDAESALRQMSARFYQRFTYLENKARASGRRLQDMHLAEMDTWWEEAKNNGL